MTDDNSAVTAVELDAITARAEYLGLGLATYPVWKVREMIRANASLRKQLDEAQEREVSLRAFIQKTTDSVSEARDESARLRAEGIGWRDEALAACKASAKKDAALREARDELTYHPTRKPSIIGVIDAALTPASQEPSHD